MERQKKKQKRQKKKKKAKSFSYHLFTSYCDFESRKEFIGSISYHSSNSE